MPVIALIFAALLATIATAKSTLGPPECIPGTEEQITVKDRGEWIKLGTCRVITPILEAKADTAKLDTSKTK